MACRGVRLIRRPPMEWMQIKTIVQGLARRGVRAMRMPCIGEHRCQRRVHGPAPGCSCSIVICWSLLPKLPLSKL
jgi:hypothetical protein